MTVKLPTLGFIGPGNVARLLARNLTIAGYAVAAASGRESGAADEFAAGFQGCTAYDSSSEVANQADLVFITTPDDVIEAVAENTFWRKDQFVVHCCGSLSRVVLISAERQGAMTGGLHPLRSFTSGLDETALSGTCFAIESPEPLRSILIDMVNRLAGKWIEIETGGKTLYHLAAVLMSNYLVTLFAESCRILEKAGVAKTDAAPALLSLIDSTLENIKNRGVPEALTGPISRGDSGTVAQHLEALLSLPESSRKVYRILGMLTIPVARAKGTLNDRDAGILQALLERETTSGDETC